MLNKRVELTAKETPSPPATQRLSKRTACSIWMKLILAAVPSVVFGIFTTIFSVQQSSFAQATREQDQHNSIQQRKETIFDNTIDAISEILLSSNFNRSNRQHLHPIEVKVVTALRRLDPSHKRDIIFYLYANKLIRTDTSPESRLDLYGADLSGIEFIKTSKFPCVLNHLFLSNILGTHIVFSGCELERSNFVNSLMDYSQYHNCSLGHAKFLNVNLEGAVFRGNMYWRIDFTGSSLVYTSFKDSNMFFYVAFINVDLFGSDLTEEQFWAVNSTYPHSNTFSNARLPNGSLLLNSKQLVIDGGAEKECVRGRNTSSPWGMAITSDLIPAYQYKNDSSFYPAPIEGGCYFLANRTSLLSQHVRLDQYSRLIDLDKVACTVSMHLGCSQYNSSFAIGLQLGFTDVKGWPMSPIPNATVTTEAAFQNKSMIAPIPVGARTAEIYISTNVSNPSMTTTPQFCAIDDIKLYIHLA